MSSTLGNTSVKTPRPASWWLAWGALGLWFVSLFLPCIIKFPPARSVVGLEILVTGWLSPVAGNLAWFANPFFLIAVVRILTGKAAPGMALAAVVLGLHTFWLTHLPNSIGSHPIYGFGWGAILWFASLLLMMAAAGSLQYEKRLTIWWKDRGYEWLKPFAFVSLVALIGVTGYLAANDRLYSGPDVRPLPSGMAFSR